MKTLLIAAALVAVGAGSGCEHRRVGAANPDSAPAALPADVRAGAAEKIDAIMTQAAGHPDHVGLSVAVFRAGEPVLVRGYGVADRASGRTVSESTPFRIGSVSKQYTAALVLLLCEDGGIGLDERVSAYLPDLGHAGEVTVRQLLNHTSGYRDFYPFDYPQAEAVEPMTQRELADRMTAMPLDFAPGTRYSYSNTGYLVAGLIVEKVTSKPFGWVLHERILDPLGLRETTAIGYDGARPDEAVGYESGGLGPIAPAQLEHPDCLIGCGGLVATPRDLVKWQRALMSGRVVSAASLREMTTLPTFPDGSLSNYGLGLVISSRSGRPSWAHGGATSGFLCEQLGVPSEDFCIVLCANSARSDMGDLVGGSILAALPPSTGKAPSVSGPPAAEVVRAWIEGLAAGRADRSNLAPDFNRYFNEQRAADSAQALRDLGPIKDVRTVSTGERGGTEYTFTRVELEKGTVMVGMYRRPDGRVEQVLVYR